MPFVRTFENVAPPARGDGVPFTKVRVRENTIPTYGTSNLIQTFVLDPVDRNPNSPQNRSFTTSVAAVEMGAWYWLVWEDDSGATVMSEPFQAGGLALSNLELLIRSEFPQTWNALVEDKYIGVATIRLRIASVKARYLPQTIALADESTYSTNLRSYIAKRATLDLIGPGLEYWMRQKTSLGTTGTNENKTLPDPIIALRELARRLTVEVEQMAGSPDVMQYSPVISDGPAVSWTGELVTANPFEFDPAFASDDTVGNEAIDS